MGGKLYAAASDWSNPDLQAAYGKSKTLAEKEGWKIVEGTNVQLTTLCPTCIRGPSLYTDKSMCDTFESGNFACKVLQGQYKFTHMCNVVIDVTWPRRTWLPLPAHVLLESGSL